jgi:DNA-3-methyladenine glycosylase I
MERCAWCLSSEAYVRYHDTEWGVPVRDDLKLFEFLVLEGAQAGLSWATILHRREGYRRAYRGFDPAVVARFTDADQARLLQDPGIVRNRAKVASSVRNAQAFLRVQEEFGSFSAYQWRFVDGAPVQNAWKALTEVPAVTPVAEAFSKDLKQRGFSFVGPTIVYAHMQAVGMVNDHLVTCHRHGECQALARP